jgi:2-succinyl-6-hydroxy-2,4-cyclohexadiene-1-carboxylate synthase
LKTDEHRIRSGGVELHALLDGDGTPVAILHGFTGSCASVEGIARDLSDHHRTLRIDFIGHGASDAPAEREPYHFDRCVDQIADVIGQLAHGPAHLIGYSMGGRVALGLCVARPELVKSATVIGARAGIENAAERAQRVCDDEALADSIEREGVPAFVTRWMALPLFASQRRIGAARLAEAREQRLANRAHGLANSLRAMGAGAQPPLHARLADLGVPVCLVVGDEDEFFGGIAVALAGELPHARVETIPRAGHAAHLENPETFLKVVRAFLDEVDAKQSHAVDSPAA